MINRHLARLALTAAALWALTLPVLAQVLPPLRTSTADAASVADGTDPVSDPLDDPLADPLADPATPPEDSAAVRVLAPPPVTETVAARPRRLTRPRPDPYAPLGMRASVFDFHPSLEVGGVATSNARRSADKADADVGLRLRPAVAFQSDWLRHSWSGEASSEFIRFLDKDNPSTVTASAKSDFRLDVRRTTHADFSLHYDLTQTGAGSREVATDAVDPRRDHALGGSAALSHDFGPLETTARLGVERAFFSDVKRGDGTTEDNSDRAYTEPTLSLRGTYRYGAAINPFAEASYGPRLHDSTRDRNGLKRNSHGLALRAGFSFDDGALWNGEMAVKYLVRDYADPALKTIQTVGLDGSLTWRPTELTTAVLTLGTELNESAAATSSGTRKWAARLDLTQALLENLDLKFNIGADYEKGDGGADITATAGTGFEYMFNPMLAIAGGYSGTFFHGSEPGDDWTDHRVLASLIWRY